MFLWIPPCNDPRHKLVCERHPYVTSVSIVRFLCLLLIIFFFSKFLGHKLLQFILNDLVRSKDFSESCCNPTPLQPRRTGGTKEETSLYRKLHRPGYYQEQGTTPLGPKKKYSCKKCKQPIKNSGHVSRGGATILPKPEFSVFGRMGV